MPNVCHSTRGQSVRHSYRSRPSNLNSTVSSSQCVCRGLRNDLTDKPALVRNGEGYRRCRVYAYRIGRKTMCWQECTDNRIRTSSRWPRRHLKGGHARARNKDVICLDRLPPAIVQVGCCGDGHTIAGDRAQSWDGKCPSKIDGVIRSP